MKKVFLAAAALLAPSMVSAQAVLTSSNGAVKIGINQTGELNAAAGSDPYTGIAYNFTGQGGRIGYQDALTPGCPCEGWGVAANGVEGQIGQSTGNQGISYLSSAAGTGSFTSVTGLSGVAGLTVTQSYSEAFSTATGSLFVDKVTIHNGTGAGITDLRYARAMDWDVPPTEFNEFSTFKGTGTTSALIRSTDNGFAYANPISSMSDMGIFPGAVNADGSFGPADHGAFFIFGFGDLANAADYSFNIYYGAGADQTDALALLSGVSPELYNLGQSTAADGTRATTLPTYVFGFSGVGGSVVVPPTVGAVPEPATWAMMIMGVGAVGVTLRRRRRVAGEARAAVA